MSNRERFLFCILIAVVILLGGFKLLIEPQIKAYQQVKTDYDNALLDKKAMENNIRREDSIYTENQNLEENISKQASILFPQLENDKMQLFFNEIKEDVGIQFTSFVMAEIIAVPITNPTVPEASLTYPIKEDAEKINGINGEGTADDSTAQNNSSENADSTGSDAVEMMSVSIQFEDTYDKALAFIDEIKNSGRTVRVSSVNMTTLDSEKVTISIIIECFGVEKFTSDELSEDSLVLPNGKNNPFEAVDSVTSK